ncbi:MAG: hypothetical protein V1723_03380 [Candidatus Uhrbacteria bacterium]
MPPIIDARVEITPIDGLELHHTKVIGDARGFLAELVQGGSTNSILAPGFGNLYLSVAVGKYTGRAGHFHFKLHERFFTITGSAVWFFHDLRDGSPTFGKSFTCVLGFDRPPEGTPGPEYVLADRDLARTVVPPGVYHGYWPLTDAPVIVLAVTSMPHDDADYDRRKPAEVPGCREALQPFGITVA